jgi:hypothetical protein
VYPATVTASPAYWTMSSTQMALQSASPQVRVCTDDHILSAAAVHVDCHSCCCITNCLAGRAVYYHSHLSASVTVSVLDTDIDPDGTPHCTRYEGMILHPVMSAACWRVPNT